MADAPRIGIIANPGKTGGIALLEDLLCRFGGAGLPVRLERASAEHAGLGEGVELDELARLSDRLVVLGGDGTILWVMRKLGSRIKPLAAINTGNLGFLTCATSDESGRLVEALASGDYRISERTVLRCSVRHEDDPPRVVFALNEIVIGRGMNARVVHVEARVNGLRANRYTGDGLIVATPTGSTAYSLSAGGPLVEPGANVFVMTPVCPHTVANRPLVVDGSSHISLFVPDQRDDLSLMADGAHVAEISGEAEVEIAMAGFALPLIALAGQDFYGVLNQKLGWMGSAI